MSKIEVLKHNQAYMAYLGLYSYRLSEPTHESHKSIVAYHNVIFSIFSIVSSVVFVQQNQSELQAVLDTILVAIALYQALCTFVNTASQMKNIKLLHLKLQEVVDQAEDEEVIKLYRDTEEKCRGHMKTVRTYVIVTQLAHAMSLLVSIISMVSGNFDTSEWPFVYNMVMPFDTRHLWGWYLAWLIQLCIGMAYTTSMTSVVSYFVNCCFYIRSMCRHCKFLVRLVEGMAEKNLTEQNSSKFQINAQKIKSKLHEAIELQANIFDIHELVANINSGTIFSLLTINAVFMGVAFFNAEHFTSDLEPEAVVHCFAAVVSSLIWPFLYCYYANIVTDRIAAFGNVMFDTNWYDYPAQLRQHVILIIISSQQQAYFTGFGMFRCTIEMFGIILKSSGTYYLIFRRFAEVD